MKLYAWHTKRYAYICAFFLQIVLAGCGGSSPEAPILNTPTGGITLFAGSINNSGFLDGDLTTARFGSISAIAMDSIGNIYVADNGNYVIRKISPQGNVTTLAGSPGIPGRADGTGSAANFVDIEGVTVDSAGNLYVADIEVRKISPTGAVTTLNGTDAPIPWNGMGPAFGIPYRANSVVVDKIGNIYASYTGNPNTSIQKISPNGIVTTFAGSLNDSGAIDGINTLARFANSSKLAIDNTGTIYVADTFNHTVRRISPEGTVTTLAGSSSESGTTDGAGSLARFNGPTYLTTSPSGDIYVSENEVIRRISNSGVVSTVAGTRGNFNIQLGSLPGSIGIPAGVLVGSDGALYVASNSAILKIKFP